jgi:hypothetical protein
LFNRVLGQPTRDEKRSRAKNLAAFERHGCEILPILA